jgi:hypothetical protein
VFPATVAISLVLGGLLLFSVIQKLGRSPAVVERYRRVGAPPERLPLLAGILGAGILGLVAGLVWAPLGIAAGVCLIAYFVLAIGAHVRHHDLGNVATPVVILDLAVASLALRAATM